MHRKSQGSTTRKTIVPAIPLPFLQQRPRSANTIDGKAKDYSDNDSTGVSQVTSPQLSTPTIHEDAHDATIATTSPKEEISTQLSTLATDAPSSDAAVTATSPKEDDAQVSKVNKGKAPISQVKEENVNINEAKKRNVQVGKIEEDRVQVNKSVKDNVQISEPEKEEFKTVVTAAGSDKEGK